MTEENQAEPAIEETAPAAIAEPVEEVSESTPEQKEHDANAAEEAKQRGVQKRIDRLTREKYEAKAKADVLEQMIQQRPQQANSQDGKPKLSEFKEPEAYIEALTDWKMEQHNQKAQAGEVQAKQQTFEQKREKLLSDAESLGDFDRDDFSENVKVTPVMAEAILDSDTGAKLLVHLNANPEEASRIANLSPARQAAEIGKLEAKLSSAPKVSKAPSPITPLGANGNTSTSKDPARMSNEEYRAWRSKNGAWWSK